MTTWHTPKSSFSEIGEARNKIKKLVFKFNYIRTINGNLYWYFYIKNINILKDKINKIKKYHYNSMSQIRIKWVISYKVFSILIM